MTAARIEVTGLINSAINELPLRNRGWDDLQNVIDNHPVLTLLSAIAPCGPRAPKEPVHSY